MANVATTSVGSPRARGVIDVVRDLFALTKPRITLIVLVTAACGMKLAHRAIDGRTWLWTLLGTSLIVGAANALNMWLERDTDSLMSRTRNRPIPAGRIAPSVALWFGVVLAVASLPMLALGVNALTAVLGVVALASYVLVYTPMKRWSILALWVGAVPGAIPPLLGWAAARGRIDLAGVSLFAILFVWQIPHFLAIAVFRADDYANAGLKVMPVERGDRATNAAILGWSIALAALGLAPLWLGLGGIVYAVVAFVLGAAFVAASAMGFRKVGARRIRWARGVFAFSIVWLVAVFTALVATT